MRNKKQVRSKEQTCESNHIQPEVSESMLADYTPKDRILSILIGAEGKPVSRKSLSREVEIGDRSLREYIAELRDEGYIIGQGTDGGYTYGNQADLWRAINKEKARVRTLSKRIKKMEKAIIMQNQYVMEVK